MPSERSKPSEITGEHAARSEVRSISLATCCKPFCTTTSVTGSIAMLSASVRISGRRKSAEGADGDLEVAERVDADVVAGLDHRRRIELLHDGGALELGADSELLAAVDRRLVPPAVEPHRPPGRRAHTASRSRLQRDEAVERHGPAPPDDRGAQAHDLGPHLAELHLEALPVGALEGSRQLLACEVGARDRHGQDMSLADELHVRLVGDAHRLDLHALA